MILSPSTAASIASWMVEKSPGTRRIAGGGGAGAAFLGAPIRQTVATARRIHFMGEAPSNCGSLRDRRDGCCGCEQNPSSREDFPGPAPAIAGAAAASPGAPIAQPAATARVPTSWVKLLSRDQDQFAARGVRG